MARSPQYLALETLTPCLPSEVINLPGSILRAFNRGFECDVSPLPLKTLRTSLVDFVRRVVSADGSDCESHVAEGRFQSPHADLRADGPRIRHAILPTRPTGTRQDFALCQRVFAEIGLFSLVGLPYT